MPRKPDGLKSRRTGLPDDTHVHPLCVICAVRRAGRRHYRIPRDASGTARAMTPRERILLGLVVLLCLLVIVTIAALQYAVRWG